MHTTILRLKTIATAINLLLPKGHWRPLALFTPSPAKDEFLIESLSGRRLKIHVWSTIRPRESSVFALIIYAPFLSSDDPRLINLADTLARVGFVVGVPWRTQGPYTFKLDEVDDIVSTLLSLKENGSLKIDHCGLFGISASNGPVMAAAADMRIKNWVDFIVSFAGYSSIENVLRFVMTGQYSYEDIQGKTAPDPYCREILSEVLDRLDCDVDSLLTEARFEQLRSSLSPATFVDQLQAESFIIHSTDDSIIPYTESLRLADVLRKRVPVHLCLIDVFEHGSYKEINLANLRQHYLPSFGGFYRLLLLLLSKLSGPRIVSSSRSFQKAGRFKGV